MNYEQAMALLRQYNSEPFHLCHAITVSKVMRRLAVELGYENEADFWAVVGLLHDIDFEQWPDEHCKKCIPLLQEAGCDDRLIHAVACHGYGLCTDLEPEHLMEKVIYHRTFSDIGAYEGEHLYLVETAYNPTPFPIFFINIEGYVYNGIPMEEFEIDPRRAMQYYVSRFHLLPFQQAKRRHLIKCAKRGYYHLETVDIYYNKKVRYINAPADCYVYPKIIPLHEIDQPNSTQQGDVVTKRWLIRDPFTLNGIREYRFGDPFNSVNFKATARSGTMDISAFKVNNRDFCSSRTFMVYLNFQIDTEVPIATKAYEQMMELGLSFASAIIRDAAYNGYKAGFAANCTLVTGEDQIRFPIKSGESHLEEILKEMAKVRHKTGISFFSMMENDVKGGLVDTEAMIEALEVGTLGGAGLDVFEEQPLSPQSPLWEMPTVYITPHTTPQVPDRDGRSIEIIRENARRFEAGEPLLNLMRKSDMMSGEGHTSGFAAAMNANMKPNPQIIKMLEKHLGKRGWTDPSEWM